MFEKQLLSSPINTFNQKSSTVKRMDAEMVETYNGLTGGTFKNCINNLKLKEHILNSRKKEKLKFLHSQLYI